MKIGDAVTHMEQDLRGIVTALNSVDAPSAALEAQRALAALQGLRDELDAWEHHGVQFEPVRIAREVIAGMPPVKQ